MKIGFFRNLRRQRVIRLQEDLDFGIKRTMRERWDFLTFIEIHQNLEELESLIQNNKIIEANSADKILYDIAEIKKNHPFDKKPNFPLWDPDHFLGDILYLSMNIKKTILLPPENTSELPSYHPAIRAWRILDSFSASLKKRRDNMEEEENRITSFILIASKKHIYYMQFIIDILIIAIGVLIGWLFVK